MHYSTPIKEEELTARWCCLCKTWVRYVPYAMIAVNIAFRVAVIVLMICKTRCMMGVLIQVMEDCWTRGMKRYVSRLFILPPVKS